MAPAKSPGSSGTVEHDPAFSACRARIDGFVGRHFLWPGTLRLHGAALGADVLRAPLNVILAPVFALTRVAALLCGIVGWRGGQRWLNARRILLPTAVARRVGGLIVTELLQRPPRQGGGMHALDEYVATRSAVAEMTTACCALLVGALVFHALTPGMMSMAPGIAGGMARAAAIADFPLGASLGGVWYGFFPVAPSPLRVAMTAGGLVMAGSVITAFAGILADPLQARLGIHRRRLLRLIDSLEAEETGTGERPFVAREHFYARLLDLWDAGASALRLFRN